MNQIHSEIYNTFKSGSKTYFNSSVFFPEKVRNDVFILYAFVRKADNFVDAIPQQSDEFYAFKNMYESSQESTSGDVIIDSFIDLMKRKNFDPQWVSAFLKSMEMDLTKSVYTTIEETLEYVYGSAEVIGLMMSAVLDLPEVSYPFACMQGRAMQYINFIRDIDEDNQLGRTYLPVSGSLHSLKKEDALIQQDKFIDFIKKEIGRYEEWQQEAAKGYAFIPRRYLIPIKTASDMYNWTAKRIFKNPLMVFERKVKPHKSRIILQILKNFLWIKR